MSCKYFHVRSYLHLSGFEYFKEKTLHVEGNKIPKANLKCTCRFTRLLNLDTVHQMSGTNIDCVTPFSCKQNNALPGGYLLYLYMVMCVWRVKFKPKNMDSLKSLHPEYWDPAYLLPKNTGDNFITELNPEKWQLLKIFTPNKVGSSCCKFQTQKMAFK